MARDQRRLAAIVSADVAGYSRLMGFDESGTLAALKAHRRELIDPKIAEYGGRIVKTTGDGLLLEFPSVVDAVRCAVDVQRGMVERNAPAPADERIEFRVGINIGDIIIDGDDIYGDGVNIAARLQALADPGGICVSKVVRDQVLDKLSFAFEDLGTQQVKNIARPIEVYRVDLEGDASDARIAGPSRGRLGQASRWRWLGAGVAVICVVGIALWTLPQVWRHVPSGRPAPLSVAVVPLAASRDDAEAVRFAEAATRDLVSRLGRLQGSAGRARVVLFKNDASGGTDVDYAEVGRKLNSRYVLEGNVVRGGEGNTVNLRLVNAATGGQVWSERNTLQDSDLSARSSSVLQILCRRIRAAVVGAEIRRVKAEPISGLTAPELVLRAGALTNDGSSLSGTLEAHKLVDRALRLDPNLVIGLLARAGLAEDEYNTDPNADRSRLVRQITEDARRAVELDPTDPAAWGWQGAALGYLGRWDAALEANAKAITLDPDDPQVYVWRAELFNYMGRPAEALPFIDRALAMDSTDVEQTMQRACLSHLLLGQAEQAVSACEKTAGLSPIVWYGPQILLIAAYSNYGDMKKAAVAKADLLRAVPGYTVAQARAADQQWSPEYASLAEKYIYEGLRRAGIPEQ